VPKDVDPRNTKGMAKIQAITITLLPDKKFLTDSNITKSSF
jgi:hypothetical protein